MTPSGTSHPTSIITHPRYMITSTKTENINVVNGAIMENPSKVPVEIISVALIANTDVKSDIIIYLQILCLFSFCFEISGRISVKTIIPRVASADNHRDISYIELGLNRQIRNTATPSEVMESRPRENRKSVDDIISINPARTTETENPVNAIYNMTKHAVIMIRLFFFTESRDSSLSIPNDKMARCIPLRARMCEMPILLKSSLSWSGK